MITHGPRVCLWPSHSWNPGPGGPFLCLIFPCFLLITGDRLQWKVILSVPKASAYLVLEKHNLSCSRLCIKKKPLVVREGMVRQPPNSLPLPVALSWSVSPALLPFPCCPLYYLLFPHPHQGLLWILWHTIQSMIPTHSRGLPRA